MANFDQSQSSRLGQSVPLENPGIQLLTEATLPENAYIGQLVYLLDLDEFRVYDGVAWQIPTSAATGGLQTFVQNSSTTGTPTADAVGDLWMDTFDFQLHVWDGSTWQEVKDTAAEAELAAHATQLSDLNTALTEVSATADGKTTIWYKPTAPGPPTEAVQNGDLWVNQTTNRLYGPYDGDWDAEIVDSQIVSAYNLADDAKTTADGKITAYYSDSPPWANADNTHALDAGDLWYDTNDLNKPYYWKVPGNTWTSVQDGSIALKTTTFQQNGIPTSTAIGDIWVDTDDSNKVYVAKMVGADQINSSEWVLIQDSAGALTVANTKIRSTYANTAPAGPNIVGDIWIDSGNNDQVKRWDGSAWILTDISTRAYAQSRGMNLVTNGSALLGNTTNFSFYTLLTSDSPGGGGCFHRVPSGVSYTFTSDELIPVDVNKTYTIKVSAKQLNAANTTGCAYIGLVPFDIDGLQISPQYVQYAAGTVTTLAADLVSGATTVQLTSSAGWQNGATASARQITVYNYTDGKGKLWPAGTYSRNLINPSSPSGAYAQGGIVGNTITLLSPYVGPTIPAGTSVANGAYGSTYKYTAASNALIPTSWTTYTGQIGGLSTNGTWPANQFNYGTAYMKLLVLGNRTAAGASDATSDHGFGNFWLSEIAAANIPEISTAQAAADAAQTSATSAILRDSQTPNPLFDDWPAAQTAPTTWISTGTAPVKETSIVRTLPYALRFNVTAGTNAYLSTNSTFGRTLPNWDYATVTIDFYLVSGDLQSAGVMLRWANTVPTNFDVKVDLNAEVPTPVTGRWYRVTKTVQRPVTFTGTYDYVLAFIGGGFSNIAAITAKNIIYDQVSIRQATSAEIQAFNSATATSVTNLSNTVAGKISTYYSVSTLVPVAAAIGDLWVVTDQNNKIKRASATGTANWVDVVFGTAAVTSMVYNQADGIVPEQVTGLATIPGRGAIYLTWNKINNTATGVPQPSDVVYEVYGYDTTETSYPIDTAHKIAETKATTIAIRELAGGISLIPSTGDAPINYSFIVRARDVDGVGAASLRQVGYMGKIGDGGLPEITEKMITADMLASVIVLGSTISTRTYDAASGLLTGAGITLNPDSLIAYDTNGKKTLEITPDQIPAAVFRGDAEIDYLTVKTLTTLQESVLAQGSKMTLQTKVADPQNAPGITVNLVGQLWPDDGMWAQRFGWVINNAGTKAMTMRKGSTYWVREEWTIATKSITNSWNDYVVSTSGRANFSTVFNHPTTDQYYVVNQPDDTDNTMWEIMEFNWGSSTPTRYYSFGSFRPGTPIIVSKTVPGLVYDSVAGNIVLVWNHTTDNKLRIQRCSLNAGSGLLTSIGSATLTNIAWGNYNIGSMISTSADFGAQRYCLIPRSTTPTASAVWVFDTSFNRVSADDWYMYGVNMVGGRYDSTAAKFKTIHHNGFEIWYEGGHNFWGAITNSTQNSTWHAGYTLTQSSPVSESRVSGLVNFTMNKRWQCTITTPTVPTGTNGINIYLSNGAAVPNTLAVTMTKQGAADLVTVPSQPRYTVTDANFGTANNPITSTFLAAAPAVIQSQDLSLSISGDGSWKLPSLGSHSTSGTALEAEKFDTGWVNFTLGDSVDIPWGSSSTTQFAQYRRVGRQVTVRIGKTASTSTYTGSVSGNFTNINISAVGALPSAVRPTQNVDMSARWNDLPITVALVTAGTFVITGGIPNGSYGASNPLTAITTYMLD